jgi:phosphatidylinositol 3-kinase
MMNTPDFLKRSNPITEKYYILTRDMDDSVAKDLRPNTEEMELLHSIINLPDFQTLSIEQKALIWRYRYSLIENKAALVKFLLCIEWTKEKEEQEGMSLLKKWAEIDIE